MKREKEIINDDMKVLLDKIKSAIDDMEEGRVISEEDIWNELNKTV
jgi:hypothetical protein